MDNSDWHDRWRDNRIGFHEGQANAMLVGHLDRLALPRGGRVFLPLCGKTRDIAWLLDRGHRVAGAELSELAITQLFDELEVEPEIARAGPLTNFAAPGIDIFVGDIFDLTHQTLGPVDGVFDRAALVALPQDVRPRYCDHLTGLTPEARQLLVTFAYDQTAMNGPPFSVPDDEVRRHYDTHYRIERLAHHDVPGGLRGETPADETAWLLTPK